MKFPKTIMLTRAKIVMGEMVLQSEVIEINAAVFVENLLSMEDSKGATGSDRTYTEVKLSHETIRVRETRAEIRAMIEALPDEDEPEQSKPADEGRLVCEECSAEYNREELVAHDGGFVLFCPSCSGRLMVAETPATDA